MLASHYRQGWRRIQSRRQRPEAEDCSNLAGENEQHCLDSLWTGSVSYLVPSDTSLITVTHADNIRGIIHKEFKITDSKAKKVDGLDSSIITVPLGQDRDKARVWAFDSELAQCGYDQHS